MLQGRARLDWRQIGAARVLQADPGQRRSQHAGRHKDAHQRQPFVLERLAVRALQGAVPAIDTLVEASHDPQAGMHREIASQRRQTRTQSAVEQQLSGVDGAGGQHDAASPHRKRSTADADGAVLFQDAAAHPRHLLASEQKLFDAAVRQHLGPRRNRPREVGEIDAELGAVGTAEVAARAAAAVLGIALVCAHRVAQALGPLHEQRRRSRAQRVRYGLDVTSALDLFEVGAHAA